MDELERRLTSALKVGRGRAVKLLIQLAGERDVAGLLWPHICAESVVDGLSDSPAGVAELIVLCGVDVDPYCSWVSTWAQGVEGSEFHGQLIRKLVELRVGGVWSMLQRWLRAGTDYDWILSHCHDLLPAPMWAELFERRDPSRLEAFVDERDVMWLRVYWSSMRVRTLIKDVGRLFPGHRLRFDRAELNGARRPSSRFAFVRDALLCGRSEQLQDVLEEGLWDIDLHYRIYCVEFVDLTCRAVLQRVETLAASFDRELAFRASRRLRES